MTGAPSGEMPFLDHLEELRVRIVKSLLAVAIGCVTGFWVVQRFHVVTLLKKPIEPFLTATGGRLAVSAPTEGVFIVFKLALVTGLLLSSPVIVYQIWAFLAPALYLKEKKLLVPALVSGLVLFIMGATLGWMFVVPQALDVLLGFQGNDFATLITFQAYYDFVIQILLALGLSFELPLILIILASLGLVTPQSLGKFRRFAIVLSFIAGAFLSPGTDVISMIMMTVPLLLLYEIGVAGSVVVHRRRLKAAKIAAAMSVLLLCLLHTPLQAQDSIPKAKTDTIARRTLSPPGAAAPGGVAPQDTSKNARVGLPSGPTRRFAEPDSLMQALMKRPGFTPTRFKGDTATIWADEKRIQLNGNALAERTGAVIEADTITYRERECLINARGDPRLFDKGKVAVGTGITYDTCRKRGMVLGAFTSFDAQGQTWFIRGNLAQDSSTTRIFATNATMTTCDLPVPHYSFEARRVKWLSDTILVARPVVLYIRDVPVLWLPFIFKDLTKRDNQRKSGVLIPSFGLTDIIRLNSGYNRSIRNIGYFWAPNDYFDATFRVDWTSRVSLTYGIATEYKILDRFLDGSFAVNRIVTPDGGSTTNFSLAHHQQFDLSTSLTANIQYTTSASGLLATATNPALTTQTISSQANFQKTFRWGSLNLGGSRTQDLSTGSTVLNPTISITPKVINLGGTSTWSPTFSTTYNSTTSSPQTPLYLVLANGSIDTIAQTGSSRTTAVTFGTPVTINRLSFANTISYNDQQFSGRQVRPTFNEASGSGIPGDSVVVNSYSNGTFQSSIDWNTAVSLPGLFQGRWNLTPSVGISNATSGPFALRNNQTNGAWVTQNKSFRFSLSSSPTFFGFLPGLFGFSRIRHSISPLISWQYQPAASIPQAYAAAVALPGQPLLLRSPVTQSVTIGLSQVFEGKTRPLTGDTVGTTSKKVRLLSIQTGTFSYDFEQAKLPGRTGFTTQTLTNALTSDLLPGFTAQVAHDLWRGQVGTDTAKFSPFLTGVQANFTMTNRTFRNILALFGLASKPTGPDNSQRQNQYSQFGQPGYPGSNSFGNTAVPVTSFPAQAGAQGYFGGNSMMPTGPGFNASVNYTLQRYRPVEGIVGAAPPTQQNVGLQMSFKATHYWFVAWNTQYDFTAGKFVSQDISLQRELHDFRATFRYSRTPGGNSTFYLSVAMIAIPELKYDFNRTSLER